MRDETMLRTIIRKEFQLHLAGFPLRIGFLLTFVLTASSTLIATRDYNLRLHAYRERIAAHAHTLQEATVYSFVQPVVVRSPEPLSVLDQGLAARLGSDVTIHLFEIPVEATGGYLGNEFLAGSPAADLTAIVSVVLGLLALLLAHDAIQSERESGKLAALYSFGVPRDTLIVGKILGGLSALILPLGGALLVGLTIFVLQVEAVLAPSHWLRVAGLVIAYVFYLSLMFLLGLLISLTVRRRARALAAAVVAWLALIILLPGVTRTLAADLWSAQEAREARDITEMRAARDRLFATERQREPLLLKFNRDSAVSFASGENRAVRYRFGTSRYYDALSSYHQTEIMIGLRYADRIFAERWQAVERLRAVERLTAAATMVSPAAHLDGVSEELAGTSTGEYDRFLATCRSYRLALIRYLDRRNAFSSWRWFTDDAPERLHPWPRFLGLAPQDVDPREIRRLVARFSDPAIASRVRREQEVFERDPARRLQLVDLPRFVDPGAGFLECLRRGAPSALWLLALNVLFWIAVMLLFRRWAPR